MRDLAAIEREIDGAGAPAAPREAAARLLGLAEEVLEAWIAARRESPTQARREGFRLLALHHQGAAGVPSFNACRETCREIAFHYNLLSVDGAEDAQSRLRMMGLLAKHLALFVAGKMQVEGLGDFCCASRPLRAESATIVRMQPVQEEEQRCPT